MQSVFPEALQSLREADPEVFGIIEDEKKRQWYVLLKAWSSRSAWKCIF